MISTFDLITLAVPLVLSATWLLKGEGRGYAYQDRPWGPSIEDFDDISQAPFDPHPPNR